MRGNILMEKLIHWLTHSLTNYYFLLSWLLVCCFSLVGCRFYVKNNPLYLCCSCRISPVGQGIGILSTRHPLLRRSTTFAHDHHDLSLSCFIGLPLPEVSAFAFTLALVLASTSHVLRYLGYRTGDNQESIFKKKFLSQ